MFRAYEPVIVYGEFDDFGVDVVRRLEERARKGPLHVRLYSDETIESFRAEPPLLPEAERVYLLESLRWVEKVTIVVEVEPMVFVPAAGEPGDALPESPSRDQDSPKDASLRGAERPRVIVTGCYDWLHSGHVRFFEEASAFGHLFVTVGNDESVARHKGPGHPLVAEEDRRYMVSAIRYVAEAVISTGDGWLDAIPEIERIRPDIWVVNEDGDRDEKRVYCSEHGIEYEVLRRLPREGLPARSSTELRGY